MTTAVAVARPVAPLLALLALAAGCRHATPGCPAPTAELVADPNVCVTHDVIRGPSTDVVPIMCGSESVRGVLVDIHFPRDGTWGYGLAPGPGAHTRNGLIRTTPPGCAGCGGVDSHTGLGYGGLLFLPFRAGETLRLVLDASIMGSETWQVGVCPDGMNL